jgi:hypothetical protein
MALEDAVVLAESLAAGTVDAALDAFETPAAARRMGPAAEPHRRAGLGAAAGRTQRHAPRTG